MFNYCPLSCLLVNFKQCVLSIVCRRNETEILFKYLIKYTTYISLEDPPQWNSHPCAVFRVVSDFSTCSVGDIQTKFKITRIYKRIDVALLLVGEGDVREDLCQPIFQNLLTNELYYPTNEI